MGNRVRMSQCPNVAFCTVPTKRTNIIWQWAQTVQFVLTDKTYSCLLSKWCNLQSNCYSPLYGLHSKTTFVVLSMDSSIAWCLIWTVEWISIAYLPPKGLADTISSTGAASEGDSDAPELWSVMLVVLDVLPRPRPPLPPWGDIIWLVPRENIDPLNVCNRTLNTSSTWAFSSAYLNKPLTLSIPAFGSVTRGPIMATIANFVFIDVVVSNSWIISADVNRYCSFPVSRASRIDWLSLKENEKEV